MRENPDDLDSVDKHAASLNNLAVLYGESGQLRERMRTVTESTSLRERLVAATPADDPRRENFLSNLGSCYGNLGSYCMDEGSLVEAAAWTRKALAIQDDQIKRRPNMVDFLERVGLSHTVLGQIEFRTGELATARTELEQGRAYLERLMHIRPAEAFLRMQLVRCLGWLSDVELESGATTLASDLARRAVRETEDTLRLNPQFHTAAQALAGLLVREAEISWDTGESDRALAALDRAKRLSASLSRPTPNCLSTAPTWEAQSASTSA